MFKVLNRVDLDERRRLLRLVLIAKDRVAIRCLAQVKKDNSKTEHPARPME